MPVNLSSPTNAGPPHRESFVKRYLDPTDRLGEVLFGLIMVLTFTGSLSVAEGGSESVRTMLIGALGCNLAWGIIDGIFFLMGCLSEQAKGMRAWRAARTAADPEAAHRVIASELPIRDERNASSRMRCRRWWFRCCNRRSSPRCTSA